MVSASITRETHRRTHAGERTRVMAHVERDLEGDVFASVGRDGSAPNERHRETAVGHPQTRELRVDGGGEALSAFLAPSAEHGRRRGEIPFDLRFARVQCSEVVLRRIDQRQLGASLCASGEHLSIVGRTFETGGRHVAAILHTRSARATR